MNFGTSPPEMTAAGIPMTSAAHLDIEESEHNRSVRLKLTGELDLGSEPVLRRRLDQLRADGSSVLLDLSSLGFMDSTGLRLMIDMLQSSQQDGWNLRIASDLSPQVLRLFRLVHFDRLIVDAPSDGP